MLSKYAESGTGGIPRRAFNDPRALASLESSNLSTQFRASTQSLLDKWRADSDRRRNPLGLPKSEAKAFIPPVGADPNKPPYNNPAETGMTYIRASQSDIALNRLERRVREVDSTIRNGNPESVEVAQALRESAVLKQQLADGRSQRDSVKASIIPRGEGVLVPTWTLQGATLRNGEPSQIRSDRTIQPYGTRTQTKLNVNSYGRSGQVDVG